MASTKPNPPNKSTETTAKEAIKHIRETPFPMLKEFVPDNEDRVTVQRAYRRKKKQFNDAVSVGRNSLWDEYFKDNYKDFAEDYAKGEETLRELCDRYGISTQTFYNLKDEKIEFFDAIKNAKEQRRDEKLGMANRGMKMLLEGGEYTETRVEAHRPPDGDQEDEQLEKVVRTRKRVLPNATMIIFTLCNLDKENWKHISTIKHEGIPDRPPVDLSNLSDEELDIFLELTQKAEGKQNGQSD